MLHEIEILLLIGRHDNIIGFIGFTLDIEKMYLVFEYCMYGNLHNFLIRLKPQFLYMINLPPSQRPNTDLGRGYGLQLASYVLQVAKECETRVKIGDFGLSKDIYETKNYYSLTRKKLPVKWMAPEAIEKQKFNTFTDVWAFGVFMWEVFKLGKEPYPDIKSSDILQFLKMGYRLEQPYCTEEWYEIMRACWKKEPKSRPGFKEIVQKIEILLDSDHVYTVLG
ncbi:fibroblast growth factor receptor 1 [Caerostris extrusa]|uniref:Fibroblast growth factor receptor 1 n=1 Tax=Caerostris extrusa TaxID=172846 RepID=A0AAV4W4U2_CAEEX|nr:fibroblast growth factor receptor 1 [Caerostris extrusa]